MVNSYFYLIKGEKISDFAADYFFANKKKISEKNFKQ